MRVRGVVAHCDSGDRKGPKAIGYLRMPNRVRRFWVWATGTISIVFVAIMWACSAQEAELQLTGPRWIDLVLSGGPETTATLNHSDETFTGISLTKNRPAIRVKTDLNNPKSLFLAGGFVSGPSTNEEGAALRYELISQDVVLSKGRIRLKPGDQWWSKKFQLPPEVIGQVDIRLKAKLLPGQEVLIKDAMIEQSLNSAVETSRGPQILLISVDTLREDALGVYGGRSDTPNLDNLAAEGERWSPHYSGGGWTKPSHAVMLTGYRGDTHLMYEEERVLDAGLPTLAQRLQASGLTTAGFVYDCKWLDPKWGFGRGFDEYHVQNHRVGRTVFEIENWIESKKGSPFFLFFHTFEPHSDWRRLPYESPGTTQAVVAEGFGVEDYGCAEGRCASQYMNGLNDGEIQARENEAEILRFLYQRGVAETDRALGQLFEHLKERGLWDQMLVIVTSDHGEAFFEHGRCLHGLVWNEIVRVPLIVKWPKGFKAGELGAVPSSSIDLAPTILRAVGIETDGLPGEPLQTLSMERPITIGGGNRMIVQGDWKINVGGNLSTIKFTSNLRDDPGELVDLTVGQSELIAEMLDTARGITKSDIELRELLQESQGENHATLTDEETKKLKALGYLE